MAGSTPTCVLGKEVWFLRSLGCKPCQRRGSRTNCVRYFSKEPGSRSSQTTIPGRCRPTDPDRRLSLAGKTESLLARSFAGPWANKAITSRHPARAEKYHAGFREGWERGEVVRRLLGGGRELETVKPAQFKRWPIEDETLWTLRVPACSCSLVLNQTRLWLQDCILRRRGRRGPP